jgi:hypothetical protein
MAKGDQFCYSCGAARREGARFCFSCGTTFDAPQAEVAERTPAASNMPTLAVHETPAPAATMPAPPAGPMTRPKEVTSAGRTLIVMGGLTVLAAFFLLAMYSSGSLEDRYDVADWFPIVAVFSGALGGLAIASGVGVLRLNPTWRIVGIVVGAVSMVGMLFNLLSGVFISLAFLFFWGRAVVGLAKSADAFRPAAVRMASNVSDETLRIAEQQRQVEENPTA